MVHEAILHFPVHPHVSIHRVDPQDKGPWGLVLQDNSVLAVVLTLGKGDTGGLLWDGERG